MRIAYAGARRWPMLTTYFSASSREDGDAEYPVFPRLPASHANATHGQLRADPATDATGTGEYRSREGIQIEEQKTMRLLQIQESCLPFGQPAALRAMHPLQQGMHVCRVTS